jgi:hypothetical protein
LDQVHCRAIDYGIFGSSCVPIRKFVARSAIGAARQRELLIAKAIFCSPPKSGNIEMLLFIILALLVILAKSLIPLAATDADFTFDASRNCRAA